MRTDGLAGVGPDEPASVRDRASRRAWTAVVAVFLLLVLLGGVLAPDYGKSWDEYVHIVYAEQTLENYEGIRAPTDTLFNLRYYGPLFSVGVESVRGLLQRIGPGWDQAAARHFAYYLSFLVGLASVYLLAVRLAGKAAALAASALFLTQPVIFGHAFMNPKDTPFMGFFAASMCAGIYAASAFGEARRRRLQAEPAAGILGRENQVPVSWRLAPLWLRIALLVSIPLTVVFLLEFFVWKTLLAEGIKLVAAAYDGTAAPALSRAFDLIAQDAHKTTLPAYLEKTQTAYLRLRWLATVGLVGLIAAMLRRIFRGEPFRGMWRLALSGVLLGATIAIRIQALFAGLLISLLFVAVLRRRAILPVLGYWLLAAIVTYFGWPFLWGDPLRRFAQALDVMRSFGWGGDVLYAGRIFSSVDLPWSYLPHLMLLQLTIPALAFGLAGLGGVLAKLRRHPSASAERLALVAWMVGPVVYLSLPKMDTYDNFRQVLFVLPPLFVFAAAAFQTIFDRVSRTALSALIVVVCLVPGLAGIVALHPYEYIYYNALAGGVRGAYRNFELDYWCLSAREGILRLNDIAAQGARVAINKDSDQLIPYAREDLAIIQNRDSTELAKAADPDYMIVCTRANSDLEILPRREIAVEVTAGGVPILTIKKVK
jgi:hypothetical protein